VEVKKLRTMTIETFWSKLTPAVCRKYIGHLQKVIPKVLEVGGEPTGY